jgi:hypothetical protein
MRRKQAFTAVSHRVLERVRRIEDKLRELDSGEVIEDSGSEPGRLHRWLPIAIVLVSLGSAAMGWQASVRDERAAHSDELARQALVFEQQAELAKTQEVDADVRLFGQYEQNQLLANAVMSDARRAPAPERQALGEQGLADRHVANWVLQEMQYPPDGPGVGAPTPYNVNSALIETETGDPSLSSVDPNVLRPRPRSVGSGGCLLPKMVNGVLTVTA